MPIHLISHTHWDREWYLTYEQFRLRLVGLIDRLLDLMEQHPDFEYFHLDGQTIVLEDYLELRPHQEPRLRTLIANGRILVGPWYDMPDEFLVSGESLVRNLALGHRIAKKFGTPMPVGYLPDLFGHVGQMPQILRNVALDNAILWRGFGGTKAEYWWQAPDGSRVLMMHLPPEGYCNATRVHLKRDEMIDRATRAIDSEKTRSTTGEVLLMNGVDHVEPHPVIPELVRELAATVGAPVHHSTLPAYVDAVRSAVHEGVGGPLDLVEGELRGGEEYANLLPGVFSSRVYIKQANARIQTLLEKRAEPLATFACMLGARYPVEELAYAWKTLLQNHPHDSICGCSIDPVHEENMTRFARAEQVARAVVDEAVDVLARGVPAGPRGALRLVAINTTGTPFRGVLEASVDLPYADAEPRRPDPEALDAPVTLWPAGASVKGVRASIGAALVTPFQILAREDVVTFVMSRYDTPWALRAQRFKLLFAGEVPACGYTCFDVEIADSDSHGARASSPATSGFANESADPAADRSVENEYVRVSVNDDGTVDVVDLRSGTRYPRCGELEDVGDVGDEYNYSPPQGEDRRITSADAENVRIRHVENGPIRAEFRIDLTLRLPVSVTDDRTARAAETVANDVGVVVSLDAGSPRVGFTFSVDNRAKDHRLRVLFPTGADTITEVRAETAFGVVTRPARRERPAEVRVEVPVSYGPTGGFTEAGGERAGAIVFGEGLMEYEAYTDAAPARLALTLLRCVGFLSRDDLVMRPSGHAGPGLPTPGAQCLGRHQFRLGFEPRARRPPASGLFARAGAFVAPPLVVASVGGRGTLAPFDAFLAIEGRAVLSACHRAHDGDGTILRLFNPDATPTQMRVMRHGHGAEVIAVDFLERPRDGNAGRAASTVEIAPHQIATFRMV